MSTLWMAVSAAAVLVFLVLLVRKPWLVMLPFVSVLAWVRAIITLPMLVRDWLAASIVAKNAAGLAHHAQAAAALWGANTEFRPAAREVFARVCGGYGIRPTAGGHSGLESIPGISEHLAPDSGAPARASAAAAVEASRGGRVSPISDAKHGGKQA